MPITPTEKIWMDGELVDWDKAQVHVLTHTLHYGSGVFEGIRAYPTSAGVAVFRLPDHIHRLFNSAKILIIDVPFSEDELVEACQGRRAGQRPRRRLLPAAHRLPRLRRDGPQPAPCPVNVAIAAWPWGTYLGDDGVANGVRLKVSSWHRHDPNAVPTAAKGTGMYLNSSLAKVEAPQGRLRRGHPARPRRPGVGVHGGEPLRGARTAGSSRRPTSDSGRWPGSPSDSVETIATDLGYEVTHEALIRTDLYTADEAFLTGTAAEVVPIREVDDRTVGEGRPGPITKQIQETYFAAVRGEVDRYKDWLEHVQ